MNTLDTLIAARELISDKAHWTRNYLATDEAGRAVGTSSPFATCFCSIGAIERVGKQHNTAECARMALGRAIYDNYNVYGIVDFNDSKPHRSILRAFDLAIKDERKWHVGA